MPKIKYDLAYSQWYRELDKFAPAACKLFVGNKIDLRDPSNKDNVTYEKASKVFVENLHVPYIECSALTRQGIEDTFVAAIKLVLERRKLQSNLCCCLQ